MLSILIEYLAVQFTLVHNHINKLEHKIMSNFEQLTNDVTALTTKVAELQASGAAASAAVQAEITRVETIIADLRANAGNAPTQDQIDAATSGLEAAIAGLSGVQSGLDAATAVVNAVEPDPAPTA
jgi:hypothetical protein